MPGFLGLAECAALGADVRALHDAGVLRAAGIGGTRALRVDPSVRADSIHWLDEPTLSVAQRAGWDSLDRLRVALNRRLFFGLTSIEAHLTSYQPGAAYRKHVDNVHGSTRRVVSCVLYLNPDWQEEHGGQLRIYASSDHAVVAQDVAPRAGTLVCFLSAEISHEVLVTTHERLSMTGWLSARQDPAARTSSAG